MRIAHSCQRLPDLPACCWGGALGTQLATHLVPCLTVQAPTTVVLRCVAVEHSCAHLLAVRFNLCV